MNSAARPSRITFDISQAQKPVFHALLEARDAFGGDTPALVDGDGRTLSYNEIIRASFALGHALKKGTSAGENVGVMLPTGLGAAIAFFALSAYGRVPTMLNFTAGEASLKSALATAQVRRIVTARRFHRTGQVRRAGSRARQTLRICSISKMCGRVFRCATSWPQSPACWRRAPWRQTRTPKNLR